MKEIQFGRSIISASDNPYLIAEIGHNHQGNIDTALKMIEVAASCGVQAVKFQKRDNRSLFTGSYYNRPYDNENSYGSTYGEHREFLEFDKNEFVRLKEYAEEHRVEFMSTVFDFPSVEILEDIGITSYKIASADITNIPLLVHVAKIGKPMFVSTGASTLQEVRLAYEAIRKHNDQLCLMHCTAGYPTEYKDLNLKVIKTLQTEFPEAIIGYSGHDNGILASVIAFMMGAVVIEKHFTLNHSWKGTDHKFSLEPEGLRKQVRDLNRIVEAMGNPEKVIYDYEKDARIKMGKSIYSVQSLKSGSVLKESDICYKSPGGGLPPYEVNRIVGKKLVKDIGPEELIKLEDLA